MIDYESYCNGLDPRRTTKNDSLIQCVECNNQVSVDQFTEQELRDDGWLLEPVVYCPVCGPDDDGKGV